MAHGLKDMGRAFEFRKERKLKRWSKMAVQFTRLGKEIVMAVKAGGGDINTNSRLRTAVQNSKAVNMPKDRVVRRPPYAGHRRPRRGLDDENSLRGAGRMANKDRDPSRRCYTWGCFRHRMYDIDTSKERTHPGRAPMARCPRHA